MNPLLPRMLNCLQLQSMLPPSEAAKASTLSSTLTKLWEGTRAFGECRGVQQAPVLLYRSRGGSGVRPQRWSAPKPLRSYRTQAEADSEERLKDALGDWCPQAACRVGDVYACGSRDRYRVPSLQAVHDVHAG